MHYDEVIPIRQRLRQVWTVMYDDGVKRLLVVAPDLEMEQLLNICSIDRPGYGLGSRSYP